MMARAGRPRAPWALVILCFVAACLGALAPAAPASASLASMGYSILRLFDRADVVRHDITAWIDPAQGTARFEDDVTFLIAGRRDTIHVMINSGARLERVVDPATGIDLRFSPALNLASLPFTVYRIHLPEAASGERTVRFAWSLARGEMGLGDPFVNARYFYAGYPSFWYPQTPAGDFFAFRVRIHAPPGMRAFADGLEEEGEGGAALFRSEAPADRLGVGVGLFQVERWTLEGIPWAAEAGRPGPASVLLEVWRPSGGAAALGSIADEVAFHVKESLRFYTERLGPLPISVHRVVEMPFVFPASYPSASTLVYGGNLRYLGLDDETGPAILAAHETGHKWLGGVAGVMPLGSAWFAEGLVEYLAHAALSASMPPEWLAAAWRGRVYDPFAAEERPGQGRSLAAIEVIDGDSYRLYEKGALLFSMLHRRLGDEAFYAAIRAYIERFRARHGTARDFEAIVRELAPPSERAALGRFFDDWARGTGVLDYALEVRGPAQDTDGYWLTLTVESRGDLSEPGAVDVEVRMEDGSGQRVAVELGRPARVAFLSRPVAAVLDPDLRLADANPQNNRWPD